MKNRALSHAISLAAIALSMSIAQAGEIVPKVHAFSSETPAQRRLASQSVDGNCLLNGKHQISKQRGTTDVAGIVYGDWATLGLDGKKI